MKIENGFLSISHFPSVLSTEHGNSGPFTTLVPAPVSLLSITSGDEYTVVEIRNPYDQYEFRVKESPEEVLDFFSQNAAEQRTEKAASMIRSIEAVEQIIPFVKAFIESKIS